MISISSLNIRHLVINAQNVEWGLLNPNNDDMTNYRLELYRSEVQENFKLIGEPSISTNHFVDYGVDTRNRNRYYHYILRALYIPSDSTFVDATAVASMPTPDVIALDVVRAERLLLKWYLRTKVWFYQARTYGSRCHNCWDDVQSRRSKHDCPVCYGTGFIGGFFDPIPGYIDFSPNPLAVQASSFGPIASQPSQSSAWTTNYPLLKVNDYMFEIDTGHRWKINQIGYNEKSRFVTKQLMGLDEEYLGHIIYNIKTPIWREPWF